MRKHRKISKLRFELNVLWVVTLISFAAAIIYDEDRMKFQERIEAVEAMGQAEHERSMALMEAIEQLRFDIMPSAFVGQKGSND